MGFRTKLPAILVGSVSSLYGIRKKKNNNRLERFQAMCVIIMQMAGQIKGEETNIVVTDVPT
jgi:hypothetical protein